MSSIKNKNKNFEKKFTALSNARRLALYKRNRQEFVNSYKKQGKKPPSLSANQFKIFINLVSNKARRKEITRKK